ncbi:UDP-4-amino-4,6-dideoxy-N-acetyl-beta-L-altrosamine transaminase [Salinimonas lutimaris]|uniref:UDP-4-amino-4, 6-dideoxy-N-acetyl-beta-L-altrosamine transaminase n=1 Tax=Salinimonas lutimaris TaxID=914153 RepID=UPI0010C0AA38|nr:UDP-4-amino-4,6-dideoxy-N-acetyl-beta-L-altrosamine transaminase [Salinimonas lutimaris]
MTFIPYGRQDINQTDIDAVVDVLKSDFITQGPAVPAFEQAIADYTRSQFCIAVNSATSALHLACMALGVASGDTVWTSPITFVASANCARYCGADVDFVDIDPDTFNLCPVKLRDKLKKHAAEDLPLPKVLIAVHMAGQSCAMKQIHALSLEYGFRIIEDASHAIGGRYLNEPIGQCTYSDICVFSFHPVKIVTTAEGGALTTNNAELAKVLSQLRSHGITRDQDDMLVKQSLDGDWFYEQQALGFNYRMTEMQAALGLSQMQRLDEFVERRHSLVKDYRELLGNLSLLLPDCADDYYSAFHLFIVRVPQGSEVRKRLFEKLRNNNIGVNVHYIPVHFQPYYQKLGFRKGQFPAAESYYDGALSLPLYPSMTRDDQQAVVDVIYQFFDELRR